MDKKEILEDFCKYLSTHSTGISWAVGNPLPFIEQYIQSKSKKEEPQWEILFYYRKRDNSISTIPSLYDGDETEPYTVKRLSDGEVFSVGDEIEYNIPEYFSGTIDSFNIIGDNCIMVQGTPYQFNINLKGIRKKAPKEEQVPIKVYALHYYGGEPNYHNHALICSERIPLEKYEPIKKAIQSVINNDGLSEYFNKQPKLYSESELLQARRDAFKEARLAWASSIKQPFDGVYKHETVEDYINSLK